MEGEGGDIRACADRSTAIYRTGSAGGVLDDRDPARIAKCPHPVEIRRYARLVNQDHGASAVGQMRCDRSRSQVLRLEIHVGEDWLRPDIAHRIGGGDE